MRELRYHNINSPIKHVVRHVHKAIANIATERLKEFELSHPDFVLECVDDHKWIAWVDTSSKHIHISSKMAEVLWAASLAYFRLYNALTAASAGGVSVAKTIDFSQNASLATTMELFRWAIDSWLNKTGVPWPAGRPCPVPHPTHASDEHVADELSLCAMAFIVHHEFAHIRLKHHGKSELDQERDADAAAIDWILEGQDEASPQFFKRVLGISTALAILVAGGIHTGKYGGISHPRSYDRLMHGLDRHIHDAHHPVWFFVAAILKLHLDNADHGAVIEDQTFDSGRACVDTYVDSLSRIGSP